MESKSSKPSVAIYIRVSTTYQIDKDSLPMQRQDLSNYCKYILNTDDFTIFEDAGYSGKNTIRPAYQEMMALCRKHSFTHILVWKIDRVSRNLLDFANMYEELKTLNITFISKNEQFDTSTAIGEAMLKIILVFAELERKMTAERVTATMLSRANNGIWNGGKIPFGYSYNKETKSFSICEPEAEIVRRIYDLYQNHKSFLSITKIFNLEGLKTRSGGDWNPVSINVIIKNPFNYGIYRYNWLNNSRRQHPKNESEWIVIENHHPPIIDKETYDKCILISHNANVKGTGTKPKEERNTHIFYHKLVCSCGQMMSSTIGKVSKSGYRPSIYLCPSMRRGSTECKSINDTIIGEFIFNYVLKMINAQKSADNFKNIDDLQNFLLQGSSCDHIERIDPEGLDTFFDMIKNGNSQKVLFENPKRKNTRTIEKEIYKNSLELNKQQRALERLKQLFLFDETSLSEVEFISQQTTISEKITELKQTIALLQSDSWKRTLSDDDFIKTASTFILKQKFADRNYANFKNLCLEIDHQVLQSFIDSIIESVTIHRGKPKAITFRNGMVHEFIFKEPL